jgi:lipopolysaccharide export LptBFGC system permease protein LptF
MKKNREIMAMKACGLDIFRALSPVIFISVILSIFSFILSEAIITFTISRQNEIWNAGVKKRDPAGLSGTANIWYKSKNNIYWIGYLMQRTQTMRERYSIFLMINLLVKRSRVKTARWVNNKWEIEKAKFRHMPVKTITFLKG